MRIVCLTFLSAIIILLTGCEHQQELCFGHGEGDAVPVEVVFDWTECPDAQPEAMCLYLYAEGTNIPKRYDFKDRSGGVINIRPGRYAAIALNSGLENTALRYSEGIESFELWLRGSFTTYSAGLCNPSDMVWLGVDETVWTDNRIISLAMREAVCRCDVDVLHIDNHTNLSSASARLSGFNEAVSAIDRVGAAGDVTICFDMERVDQSSLRASIYTLGHCGMARSRMTSDTDPVVHNISIGFALRDGSSWVYTEDVSEQIHEQPTAHCHIVIDSIALPVAASPGGGFNIDVDSWETIEYTIKP